ncbi:RNA polymerase sigma factor [Paenibacillus turpanensis]|uniref:RNA polymerase sigma factor n=1 Tax=Paenibacillus turpanensis TaxID=2689078 RepID=UPI00140DDBDB|nr:RNA polymerase sigma factor [Paenibacillus turpanensis]
MDSKLNVLLVCDFDSLHSDAQKAVYSEFYQFSYGPIYYMVNDHAATEDIIQEAFWKVIRKIPSEMSNETQFKTWLRVVVKNMTYNYLRKHKKIRNEVNDESVFIDNSTKYATSSDHLQNEVEAKVMAETISAYLHELKPELRVLIELRWHQQLSYKEIAASLDTDENTVRHKLYRAREAIKKRFRKDWGDPR